MNNLRSGTSACSALAMMVAVMGADAVYAQSASIDSKPAASAESDGIEEIVVTARKRAESLMSVPVSVAALSGADLERTGAKDLTTIAQQAPALFIAQGNSGSGASVTMRGIGSSLLDAGIEQSVSINIDGVQISRGKVATLGMFDLGQVEVLKGPQALFFGKNSPAGVISLTSKGPTDQVSGYALAGYEFNARQRYVEAAVGGPITDTLGARIAVRGNKLDGWLINRAAPLPAPWAPQIELPGAAKRRVPGGSDLLGRLTLHWEPTSRLDMTGKLFIARHTSSDPASGAQVICPAGQVPTSFGTVDPTADCKLNKFVSNTATPDIITAGFPHGKSTNKEVVNAKFFSLNVNYKLSDVLQLTSQTGYYTLKADAFHGATGDYTSVTFVFFEIGENTKNFTQELRLSSSFDGPFNFTVGGFYEKGSRTGYNDAMIAFAGVAPGTNKYHSFERYVDTDNETQSAFGQVRWSLLDNVELAGGARWTHEKRTATLVNVFVHPGVASFFRPQGVPLDARFSGNNVSPEATLSWHPTRNSTLYAAYKTGYKSGGISSTAVVSPIYDSDNIKFRPEKVSGAEIGYKGELLDRRLRIEGTLFRYTYKGLQLTSYDAPTITYFIKNAAKARTQGFDLSALYKATRELTLRSALAYTHARYVNFAGAPCWGGQTAAQGCVGGVQDLTGTQLVRAPDWTANVGADYDFALNDALRLGLSMTGRYTSSYFSQENQNPVALQKGYWLLDASARLYSDNGGWELALIGRNLTNKYYQTALADKTGGLTGEISGPAGRNREVALQATYRF